MKQIFLWTLGDLENKIFPSSEGLAKFKKQLEKATKGDVGHIVWGPDVKVVAISVSGGISCDVHVVVGAQDAKEVADKLFKKLRPPRRKQ